MSWKKWQEIEINTTSNWTINELFIWLLIIPNLYIYPPSTARAAWPQLTGLTRKVLVLMLGSENFQCFCWLSQGSTGIWAAVFGSDCESLFGKLRIYLVPECPHGVSQNGTTLETPATRKALDVLDVGLSHAWGPTQTVRSAAAFSV